MIFKSKPRFELLDQYLANKDYTSALEAIAEEIKSRPENFNLLLRQAEILASAGHQQLAVELYRKVARFFAEQGFYARAIAVANKVLRIDPHHQEITKELAQFIAAKQQAEEDSRARFKLAPRPGYQPPKPAPAQEKPPAEREAPTLPETPIALPVRELPPPPAEPVPAEVATPREPAVSSPQERQEAREREASKFFAYFPQGALEQLLSSTSVRTFGSDDVVVREGEQGTSFFLIEEGSVKAVTNDPEGHPLTLGRIGAGEFFGEVAVLTGKPRTATIVAETPITLIEIDRENLHRIAQEYPEVHEVLRRFYEQRAQAAVDAMLARLRGARD
jgi:tetratricopeptide (TPR) repeat protein